MIKCPKCNDAWIFASENDYGSDYENLGYRGTCKCGKYKNLVHWHQTKEEAIKEWNSLVIEDMRGEKK